MIMLSSIILFLIYRSKTENELKIRTTSLLKLLEKEKENFV